MLFKERFIGGYHGAKLRRYQEFVDSVMMNDLHTFTTQIGNVRSDSEIVALTSSLKSLNMLNAKYFIFQYQSQPFVNTSVYGPAWIVNDVQWANNANEDLMPKRRCYATAKPSEACLSP